MCPIVLTVSSSCSLANSVPPGSYHLRDSGEDQIWGIYKALFYMLAVAGNSDSSVGSERVSILFLSQSQQEIADQALEGWYCLSGMSSCITLFWNHVSMKERRDDFRKLTCLNCAVGDCLLCLSTLLFQASFKETISEVVWSSIYVHVIIKQTFTIDMTHDHSALQLQGYGILNLWPY